MNEFVRALDHQRYTWWYVAALVAIVSTSLTHAQNAEERSLLHAAKAGSGVLPLLQKGVSVETKDEHGRTSLHLAAAHGHQGTAEMLLKYGARINELDNKGNTPLDLAESSGHPALAEFLRNRGGASKQRLNKPPPASGQSSVRSANAAAPLSRMFKPSLKFKTVQDFEREIGEPALLLDSTNVCFFVPRRREKEARIIFGYLVKAYAALHQTVGTHTDYKIAVYAFPKGNPHGWGGTSECSIEYDDSNLDLDRQPEWLQHRVPHVSGYIEEMAHNFVHATRAQFGWEMIGWSLGAEVSRQIADNPVWAAAIRATREEQQRTFNQYVANGHVFPRELPANQCDRIHAWLLYQWASRYGPRFWSDFFREVRAQKQPLMDAANLGNADRIRNARYQITIGCFDRLRGVEFKKALQQRGISLTTDVKSLHPEAPGWNRRLTE